MNRQLRQNRGSIILLMLLVICFVVVPVIVLAGQIAIYSVAKVRTQSAVEAAGLLAANDLSRIIINDENFGYVSLSNYPPIGKATCAEDGEPLPVLGINTLVGTVRQNTIIAGELNNQTMAALVDDDRVKMQGTIKSLNAAIKNALKSGSGNQFHDIQGAKVDAAADVKNFLEANLPAGVHLQSVKLSSGWLGDGGDTTIAVPQPEQLAHVKPSASRGGKYLAFTDMPVGTKQFTFAGVGRSTSMVSGARFKPADDKHICSIVKIDCTVTVDNVLKSLVPFGLVPCSEVQASACCQPYALADSGPTGAMTLRFSSGPVVGLQNWRDFLNGGFHDNQITTYDVVGGDYPLDSQAQMLAANHDLQPTTSQQFATHLYYWLRNGHVRPRIDAVLNMINDPFRSGPAQIYAYEFARDGSISRRIIAKDPFPIGVTSDAQNQTIVDTSIQGGLTPIIVFRDDVQKLGTAHGGQHAGQPLAGYPLNWCELSEYGGDEHTAAVLEKGRLGTGLALIDPSGRTDADDAINDPNCSLFQSSQGKRINLQPRRSFYSGGLALDIEIGGTNAPQPVMIAASPPPPPPAQAPVHTPPAHSVPVPAVAPTPQRPQAPPPLPPILNVPGKLWVLANRKI